MKHPIYTERELPQELNGKFEKRPLSELPQFPAFLLVPQQNKYAIVVSDHEALVLCTSRDSINLKHYLDDQRAVGFMLREYERCEAISIIQALDEYSARTGVKIRLPYRWLRSSIERLGKQQDNSQPKTQQL